MSFLFLIAVNEFMGSKLVYMSLFQGEAACSLGCVCHQQDSDTEELSFDSLQEVVICQCKGATHELAFLKRLLRWASALKTITIGLILQSWSERCCVWSYMASRTQVLA